MLTQVQLNPGEQLRLENTRVKGTMQETDVTTYAIIDAAGVVVGSVVHTDSTAIRGFRRTQSVLQRDAAGSVVVEKSW